MHDPPATILSVGESLLLLRAAVTCLKNGAVNQVSDVAS